MDVSSPASVARLASAAPSQLGGPVDVWINNAGYSGSFQAPPPPSLLWGMRSLPAHAASMDWEPTAGWASCSVLHTGRAIVTKVDGQVDSNHCGSLG